MRVRLLNYRYGIRQDKKDFRSITTSYFRGAKGLLLVYDITNEQSFNNVQQWMNSIKTYADPDAIPILIANKMDLEDKREISTSQGKALADEYNIHFYETSAKSKQNVDEAFMDITTTVFNQWNKRNEHDNTRSLNGNTSKITSSSSLSSSSNTVHVSNGNGSSGVKGWWFHSCFGSTKT